MERNWKALHRRSLQENRPRFFRTLVRTGELERYLEGIDQEASEMYAQLVVRLSRDPARTPDQVQRQAEELVLHEFILVMDEETLEAERHGGYVD